MILSLTEENYLKCIYSLAGTKNAAVNTNAIAADLNTKPASVSDMIKKLASKGVLNYVKYKGVTLTEVGIKEALKIVRKHRLWEVFLVEKLKFNWDEVHDIAEQLEHIKSPLLINRLDDFLGNPRFDPHGDAIPNEHGEIISRKKELLFNQEVNSQGVVVGVKDSSSVFLKHLDKIGISLGSKLLINEIIAYDMSMEVTINDQQKRIITKEVASNIYIAE